MYRQSNMYAYSTHTVSFAKMCPIKDVPTSAPNRQQAMEHVMLNGQVVALLLIVATSVWLLHSMHCQACKVN